MTANADEIAEAKMERGIHDMGLWLDSRTRANVDSIPYLHGALWSIAGYIAYVCVQEDKGPTALPSAKLADMLANALEIEKATEAEEEGE